MANKKLTDFPAQSVLDYSSQFYAVPFTGPSAFTDTRVSVSVMFDTPTFTGVVTMPGTLNVTTALNLGGLPVATTTGIQTLTNKTLTAPIISTIVNTGTLTLPTSTDTLVGRNTTDTLTNKTLTAPTIATITNGGTITIPSGTDQLVGRATTDTLTNKTLTSPTVNTPTISGGTLNNNVIGGVTPAAGSFTTIGATGLISPSSTVGIKGTVTNDSAQAGSIGEILTGTTNATSLTTGTPTNGTSVSLTAGDWDVSGVVRFNPAGTTTMAQFIIGINTVSATFNAAFQQTIVSTATFTTGNNQNLATPVVRISLSGTTTVFLVVQSTFGVSTLNCDSFIRARRVR